MSTQKRDPRLDPKPGDVLRHALCKRVTVVELCDQRMAYEVWENAFDTTLGQWRQWAKDAEVIHAAE